MILQQLIRQPTTSSQMFVCDPFRLPDEEELVKEVIGLANADVDGPRYILFGINPGALEDKKIVGISDDRIADLKKAHRLISSLVEPIVHLAFIFDRIDNRLVGALEIDGCDEGPYVAGPDSQGKFANGHTWVRSGRDLREVETAELAAQVEPETFEEPEEATEPQPMRLGFNETLDCDVIRLDIPDSSDPPFAAELKKARKSGDLTQTLRQAVSTMTSQMLNVESGREQESGTTPENKATGEHTNILKASESLFADAQAFYFFEETALRVNFTVCNDGEKCIKDANIELGFPRNPHFDVADRLHANPFDRSTQKKDSSSGYPKVERNPTSILVNGKLDSMEPGSPIQVFQNALRFAVGPAMAGRKLGIVFKIRSKNDVILAEGRVKIIFGQLQH